MLLFPSIKTSILKNIFIAFTTLFVLFSCFALGLLWGFIGAGVYIRDTYSSSIRPPNSGESTDLKIGLTELDFLPDSIDDKTKTELLEFFDDNYTLTFNVTDEADYLDYINENNLEDIKLNLSYFKINLDQIFDTDLDQIIKIEMYDDLDRFSSATDTTWDPTSSGAGLQVGLDRIYLYEPIEEDRYFFKFSFLDLLSHELVHIYQHNVASVYVDQPTWFLEGMADEISTYYLYDVSNITPPSSLSKLEDGIVSLIEIDQDESINYYKISHEFYTYLENNYGQDVMFDVLLDDNINFEEVIKKHLKESPEGLYQNYLETRKEGK